MHVHTKRLHARAAMVVPYITSGDAPAAMTPNAPMVMDETPMGIPSVAQSLV